MICELAEYLFWGIWECAIRKKRSRSKLSPNYFKVIILILGMVVSTHIKVSSQCCPDSSSYRFKDLLAQNIAFTKDLNSEKDSLSLANKLMIAKRSKSSNKITRELLKKLEKEDRLKSRFGLRVRLVHGSALIHAENNREVFNFLWALKDDSKAQKEWSIYAETCRVIASILEYSRRSEQSLENLRDAQRTIKMHQLDSVYPHFAVRMASWHNQFGDQDSLLFYAQEAIRAAPKVGKVFEEAEGNLLMAIYYNGREIDKALEYYQKGAPLYKKIGEYESYSAMFQGMARLELRRNNPIKALRYVDTVMQYIPFAYETNIGHRSYVLILKGDIYKQLGQLDSAVFYFKKGYSNQLEQIQNENLEKVVEIDNKYNVEKKTRELEGKNREIQTEKERRTWAIAFASLVLIFAIVLIFYFLKLRAANKLTREQSEELKSLDVAKSHFFANISHELRTPLTLMLGPVRMLLKEGKLSEKKTKLLNLANESGKQLHNLVNQILDLRKLEMGKMQLSLEPTYLASFFERYVNQFESLAEQKKLDFSYQSDVGKKIIAQIDQEKCLQILNNLLSNAFKFTPSGGQVQVRLALANNILLLEITDSGRGIHPDELPHVFDRFFQATGPDKAAEGGTGIGLALCYAYAKLFGGDIEVESNLGLGSVFKVIFPVELVEETSQDGALSLLDQNDSTSPEEQVSIIASPAKYDPSKPRILVVEDNHPMQEYVRIVLQESYNVFSALNGLEALALLNKEQDAENTNQMDQTISRKHLPNLIISDLMMPQMDGYQLLEKLKTNQTTQHLPVIMLTARAEQRDKLQALRLGVDDYLFKPFDPEELLARIDNLLTNSTIRQTEIQAEEKTEPNQKALPQPQQKWLADFEAFVKKHYADSILSVPMLAEEFAMSESTLLRQLKRMTGLSPLKYIQEVRLDQARQLLENQAYDSVSIIADKVGYNDVRVFSRNFKKRYGKLPSELLESVY